jgi:molybdopterin/thiamine biosynthesis adenylyltransferase
MLRFVNAIVVIGCGGIGTWLLGPLLRFLAALGFRGEVRLWDGDRYTPQNQSRQEFAAGSVGLPKAEVQAAAFRANYPALRIYAHPEYVLASNVQLAVPDRSLVFVCVDNHPARALVDLAAAQLPNVCIICAGNEKVDGNVHLFLRRAGKNLTVPLLARHPEIAKARAGDRAELGCEDRIAQGETQLLVTNFLAAAACIAAFHALWTHGERTGRRKNTTVPQEVFFDAGQCAMSLVQATPDR